MRTLPTVNGMKETSAQSAALSEQVPSLGFRCSSFDGGAYQSEYQATGGGVNDRILV
jgi:hypothetical protein